MIVFPNAKINIGLNITARRPDGYHEIETVMTPVGWKDILEIVPAKGESTTLTVTGRKVDCPMEKNLVYKAYRRMAEEVDLPNVDIYLHKIIPDGAGLGGGSADASFTLKALNEMFALDFSVEHLAAMASDLGADCPFFIYNRPMLATGIGTDLSPLDLDLADRRIIIVKPPVGVSTKEAYAGVSPRKPEYVLADMVGSVAPEGWSAAGVINDFERSVFPSHPEIAEIKHRLLELGADYAAMSGSGSAVFGVFSCDKLADKAASSFEGMDCFADSRD